MKQRDKVAMTADEVAAFLAGSRKLQLATINRDGTPHLVTMYYVMLDGRIAFWTYRASQKALNLARDPADHLPGGDRRASTSTCAASRCRAWSGPSRTRPTCCRSGAASPSSWPERHDGLADDYVEHTARKRLGYIVQPTRVISWDHVKLLPPPGG